MRHKRVGERSPYHARPRQLVGRQRRGWTNIWFGIEAQTRHLEQAPQQPHHRGVEVLLAHAVVTAIALHTFVALDGRTVDRRVDVDRAHRTNISAVAAGYALFLVY